MSYTRRKIANFGLARAGALANAGYFLTGDTGWTAATEVLTPESYGTGICEALVTFPAGFAGRITWTHDTTAAQANRLYAIEEINPGDCEYQDAAVSTRSTYAGGAVASVTNPVTVGTNNDKTGYTATTVSDKTGYSLNLAQVGLSPRALDAVADASLTVGDALVAAISAAAGKEATSGTSYVVKTPSTGTVIRTFVLDSATAPSQRN